MARDPGLDAIQCGGKFAYAQFTLIRQEGKNAATRGVDHGVEYELSIHIHNIRLLIYMRQGILGVASIQGKLVAVGA